ncbi:glycosyltransferase [Pedobacter sp. P351]|uniref:glycosyltransferase n=1 Tax=Pedobacter superstes TaxID=3133441 RepID=UPI0030B314C4
MIDGGKRLLMPLSPEPAVSIITVIKNAGGYLEKFLKDIDSFLSDEVELVIVDGGSTDQTCELLQADQKIIDYWISEPDKGIYDAMNKATQLSRGQWLLFLGVDDNLLEDFSIMKSNLQMHDTIYYGNVIHNGKKIISKATSIALSKFNICHQSIFYPKRVFEKYSYKLKYPVCSDYYLNIQCKGDPDFKFHYYDLDIADHADGGFSSQVGDKAFIEDKESLIRDNLGFYTLMKYRIWNFKKRISTKLKFLISTPRL